MPRPQDNEERPRKPRPPVTEPEEEPTQASPPQEARAAAKAEGEKLADSVLPEGKRLASYGTGGRMLEGERIDFDDVMGEEVQMTDFVLVPSRQFEGHFAVIQLKRPELDDDVLYTMTTGAGAVIDLLKQAEAAGARDELPLNVKFVWRTSQTSGRKYIAVE